VNLCEERQRIRRLRAYEQQGTGAPMSLRHTFSELRPAACADCKPAAPAGLPAY
jgi:hypothetical protein